MYFSCKRGVLYDALLNFFQQVEEQNNEQY